MRMMDILSTDFCLAMKMMDRLKRLDLNVGNFTKQFCLAMRMMDILKRDLSSTGLKCLAMETLQNNFAYWETLKINNARE